MNFLLRRGNIRYCFYLYFSLYIMKSKILKKEIIEVMFI